MTAIVCVNHNWAIGQNGKLLFRIPADLRRFRKLTTGCFRRRAVLMGRKTFESIGRPLNGRKNMVLSRNPAYDPRWPNVTVLHSLAEARAAAKKRVCLIGGAELYAALLDDCDRAFVTQVDCDCAFFNADAFFPNLDQRPGWRRVRAGPWQTYKNLKYRFCEYKNTGEGL
ncbi:MAG: dihydrofolate reductase [Oscillospiraceae bacterium]|jgi:dihydrofolate reductase|nr:dihydrofolate reductase [Oscillospiraceae bacterium]